MSRSSTLIVLGVLIVIAPFSGLPSGWLRIILIVLGFVVGVIGFLIRVDRVKAEREAAPPASPPLHHDIPPVA